MSNHIDIRADDWSRCIVERQGVRVTIETQEANIEAVYDACEAACLGNGFGAETVREWFRSEDRP